MLWVSVTKLETESPFSMEVLLPENFLLPQDLSKTLRKALQGQVQEVMVAIDKGKNVEAAIMIQMRSSGGFLPWSLRSEKGDALPWGTEVNGMIGGHTSGRVSRAKKTRKGIPGAEG